MAGGGGHDGSVASRRCLDGVSSAESSEELEELGGLLSDGIPAGSPSTPAADRRRRVGWEAVLQIAPQFGSRLFSAIEHFA
jgi:hypothetical protein